MSLCTSPSAPSAQSLGSGAPGWLGMGPSNCVKPMGSISLQESTEVLLIAVNWGMKAHQQAAVLALTSKWCAWPRGIPSSMCARVYAVCVRVCVLHTVWMSNPVRRGVCLGRGVKRREHNAMRRMESIQDICLHYYNFP